jgi:hypothetical protein
MRNLFHSDWFREDRSHQKNALIFMEMAKKPVKVSAAGLFEVNLEVFVRICNAAYSLFAVLKKIN